MNNYIINITKTLKSKSSKNYNCNDIMELISQFNDHVSIKEIQECYPEIIPDVFTFSPVSLRDIKNEIMNLHVKKSSSSKLILAKTVQQLAHIYLPFLTNSISYSLHENTFLDKLKQYEVIPLYKELDPLKKENCRSISV